MVDFGSEQGRSFFVTAGVARYVEDCKKARTPFWAKRCHFWMDTNIIKDSLALQDCFRVLHKFYKSWEIITSQ